MVDPEFTIFFGCGGVFEVGEGCFLFHFCAFYLFQRRLLVWMERLGFTGVVPVYYHFLISSDEVDLVLRKHPKNCGPNNNIIYQPSNPPGEVF